MAEKDFRDFDSGWPLPKEGYCDQPYVVKAREGHWVCIMTTGEGVEGASGQHIISTTSSDHGRNWTAPVDIEPADGPEASWVMPFRVPESGRIFAFYTYNKDNLREVITNEGMTSRVDTLGGYFFKFSDDSGRSWSERRYEIPVREFQWDRENPYRGKVRLFWGVGKPILHDGVMYLGFAKVGNFGHGFMYRSEGAFLKSTNILTEQDPENITFETLPDGETGLRGPHDRVADEHNPAGMSDGSLYCTYRTIEGHNCHAYSRDGGHNWTPPEYARFSPDGRLIKHPRAANFVRKFENGRYLLWFHNNGTRWYNNGPAAGNRNVAWACGGREKDGFLHWSEPEVLLYTENQLLGASYPDFIEDGGRYFILATQKTEARVVKMDSTLLEGLWNQDENRRVARNGLALELMDDRIEPGMEVDCPELPPLSGNWNADTRSFQLTGREGFTLEIRVRFRDVEPGQLLISNNDRTGKGFSLSTAAGGAVRLELCDGWTGAFWDSDPGLLTPDRDHHVVVIVDGAAKIISCVIDGRLCDGGEDRAFGWGRLSPYFRDVNSTAKMRIAPCLHGTLKTLRVYSRYLRTSEAVGNCRAGS